MQRKAKRARVWLAKKRDNLDQEDAHLVHDHTYLIPIVTKSNNHNSGFFL